MKEKTAVKRIPLHYVAMRQSRRKTMIRDLGDGCSRSMCDTRRRIRQDSQFARVHKLESMTGEEDTTGRRTKWRRFVISSSRREKIQWVVRNDRTDCSMDKWPSRATRVTVLIYPCVVSSAHRRGYARATDGTYENDPNLRITEDTLILDKSSTPGSWWSKISADDKLLDLRCQLFVRRDVDLTFLNDKVNNVESDKKGSILDFPTQNSDIIHSVNFFEFTWLDKNTIETQCAE